MYIKYTGTLDSACTITLGPNTTSRVHIIENGTSGSQNIIISQGSGANVTIPAGDVKVVYLDGAGSGAAVVDAFASLNVVDLKVEDDLTVTDDATIGGTLGVTGVLTANAGIDIDNFNIDGTTIALSSGDLTIDVAGDINIDADGGDILLKDGGTSFGQFSISSGDLYIQQPTSDKDIVFRGLDDASYISALTLDMSAAGRATFNSSVLTTGVYGASDGNSGIQFDGSDVVTLHTGGNLAQQIDANGHITMPLQPAFLVNAAAMSNIAIDGARTVTFSSEVFDQNADFNTGTYTFTAPVTGKYYLTANIRANAIPTNATYFTVYIVTSNRNVLGRIFDPDGYDSSPVYDWYSAGSIVDMDASDTAYVAVFQYEGTAQTDITVDSIFSGYLAC